MEYLQIATFLCFFDSNREKTAVVGTKTAYFSKKNMSWKQKYKIERLTEEVEEEW